MAIDLLIFFYFQHPVMVMEQQRDVEVEGICHLIHECFNSTLYPENWFVDNIKLYCANWNDEPIQNIFATVSSIESTEKKH